MSEAAAPGLGIVVALPAEARCLGLRARRTGLFRLTDAVDVALCGMGAEAAARAAATLSARGAGALLSYGTAGALAPGVPPGQLLLPARVLTPEGHTHSVDPGWHQALGALLRSARPMPDSLLSVAAPVVSVAAKARLRAGSGAGAVDMESAAVAEVAGREGLPFAVLRTVVDAAEHTLPGAALAATAADGSVAIGRLLSGLGREPAQIAALLRLMLSFAAARRALQRATALSAGRFAWPLAGSPSARAATPTPAEPAGPGGPSQ